MSVLNRAMRPPECPDRRNGTVSEASPLANVVVVLDSTVTGMAAPGAIVVVVGAAVVVVGAAMVVVG